MLGFIDIYNSNSTQVLGLVWLIIYKYQNINKGELLQWVTDKLKPYIAKMGGANVRDFTSSWQSGIALCALVHSMTGDTVIDMNAVMSMDPSERVQLALSKAESALQIPALLEAHDVTDSPVESVIMTYLSSARNKNLHGSIVKERDDATPVRRSSFTRPTNPVSTSTRSDTPQTAKKPPVAPVQSPTVHASAASVQDDSQIAMLKAEIERLEHDELEPRKKKIRDLEAALATKDLELAAKNARISSLESNNNSRDDNDDAVSKKKIKDLEHEVAVQEVELAALTARLSVADSSEGHKHSSAAPCAKCEQLNSRLRTLELDLANKDSDLSQAELQAAGDTAKISKLEQTVSTLKQQLATAEKAKNEAAQSSAGEDASIKVAELEKNVRELQERLSTSEKANSDAQVKLAQKDAVIAQLESAVISDSKSSSKDTKKLKKELESLRKKTTDLEADVVAKESRIAELEASQEKKQTQLSKVSDELDRVMGELSSARATNSTTSSEPLSPRDKKKSKKSRKRSSQKSEKDRKSSVDASEVDPKYKEAIQHVAELVAEVEKLKTEVKDHQGMLVAKDDEIRGLKEKNLNLISQMKTELKALLKKQQDDSEMITILKQKVASYSSELINLQVLIREKGLTDVTKLEHELQKISLQNEELQKKIAALEKEMLDAQRRAEALSADLDRESSTDDAGGSAAATLKEQLDAARYKLHDLLEWRRNATSEMANIRSQNEELTQLLKLLDSKLKEVSKTASAAASSDNDYMATYDQSHKDIFVALNDVVGTTAQRFDILRERIERMTVPHF